MTEEITGVLRPRTKRLWLLKYGDRAHCDAATSQGDRFELGYEGVGRKRIYYVRDHRGAVLALSRRMYTTGWRSYSNDSLQFLDGASGLVIAEYSGPILPTQLRVGDVPVPCRRYLRKWFRPVYCSEYFEFESRASRTEVAFVIKRPQFLVASLCCGYLDFVLQSEAAASGG